MALEFLKLHSNELEKQFTARPAKDPMPAKRQKVIEGIDKALAQLKAGETSPKRGWYSSKEGVEGVRVQIKSGMKPLTVDGRSFWVVDDATKFYTEAKRAVQEKKLDDAISAASTSKAKASSAGRAESPSRSHGMRLSWYKKDVAKLGQEEADKKLSAKVEAGNMTQAEADAVRKDAQQG